MKQFKEDQQLKHMTVPTVEHSHHQAQLRRVLVSRAAERADDKPSIVQGVMSVMKKRTILTGTGVAGILAVAVLAFSVVGPSQSVSALQLAQNSSKALAGMTSQEADYQKHYPYFVDWMNQAQHASDLRLLSYDQFAAAYPHALEQSPVSGEPLRIIDNPSDGKAPNIHELRYLEFTVTDGDTKLKVVVGVNNENIPEAALQQVVEPGKSRSGA